MQSQTVSSRSRLLPNQIQLVKIRRGEVGISPFELQVFELDKAPSFAALSYVRGTELAVAPLKCLTKAESVGNGDDLIVKDILIPSNLNQALNQLSVLIFNGKTFLGKEYIWIDALCIDQSSDVEKGEQILNMHRIYGSATEILIYLGEAQHDSNEALAAIVAIASKMTERDNNASQLTSQDLDWNLTRDEVTALATAVQTERRIFESETNFRKEGLPGLVHPLWMSLAALYSRNWFERLWTFQEALLASKATVICGDNVVNWSDMRRVGVGLAGSQLMYVKWKSLSTIRPNHPDHIPQGAAIRCFREDYSESLFDAFFTLSREREVSNDHDRIYALLGLAPAEVREEVVVRYDAPLSEVYGSFSKATMKHFYLHAVLRSVRSKNPVANLPSWCPDYRCQSSTLYIPAGHCRSDSIAKELTLSSANPRIITVAGAELDVVAQVVKGFRLQWHGGTSQVYGANGDAAKTAKWMDSCQALVETFKPDLSQNEIKDLLTMSLLAHNPSHEDEVMEYPKNAVDALQKIRSRLRKLALGTSHEDVEPLTDELGNMTNETFATMCKIWIGDSVFFATRAGRFGIAYDNIRAGDQLVALFSSGHIYALRPVTHDSQEFVSVCHVTELSDGQIFSEADLVKARKEFVLV